MFQYGTQTNIQAAALAASEYPVDESLPTIYFGQNENDSASLDFQANPSTIRHNSIHRYTLTTRTIAHYCRLEQVGEGTYGQVYRAKCLTPTLSRPKGGEMVALKKIRLHHPGYWGIPPTVIREIKILKKLQHKNMVKMYEVVSSKGVEDLDWEDEWEDEKRKKESKNNNNTTPPLVNPDDIDSLVTGANVDKSCKKNDDRKSVSLQISSHADSTKKKKKDSMSDLEKLRESYKGNLFLVLEYISHDLTGLLDMANKFTEVQTKSIIKQLLEVLEFMHVRNYVHRDLKSSNVLITDNYEVKLADFGLARCLESSFIGRVGGTESYSKEGEYTNKVITLWYRPPELLLGETKYGTAVDIWSAGCILAEIILGRPIFTGKTDIDQLKLIFDLIGTPTERTWEGFGELKLIRTGEVAIDKVRRPKLRDKYGSRIQPATALSLLEKLLELDPKKRFTASRALHHRYFKSDPVAPEDPRNLGTINLGSGPGYHEFQTKKRRREAKAVAKNAEEEAKLRGEAVEKQKEAFDKAYRDHLMKGANAEMQKEKVRLLHQGHPVEEYREVTSSHHLSNNLHDNRPRPLAESTPSRVKDMPPPPHDIKFSYNSTQPSRDGSNRKDTMGESRGQSINNRHDISKLKHSRAFDRDKDLPCKRGRYHDRFGIPGGTSSVMENMDESKRDGYDLSSEEGPRIVKGSLPAPLPVPAHERHCDRYGNPVGEAPSRIPSGLGRGRNLHSQEVRGEYRDWDRGGGYISQGLSRPLEWGSQRGMRDGWPPEKGRHQD